MFEVEPVGKRQPQARPAAVDKRFRAFDPHQVLLLPPSLDDWLPKDHLARFVADLVDKVLDLGQVRADYTGKRGYPPYDPRLMLRLLIYGYTTRVRSSRAIEQRCADDIAFRFLAADQAPGFRSISRFRRRHLDAIAALFTQSLHLAQKLGMVKMGRIALDGTKLEANASKHKAMSYGRLVDKEERIEAEVAALEAKAAALLPPTKPRARDSASTARTPTCLPSATGARNAWPGCRPPARRSRPKPPTKHERTPKTRSAVDRSEPAPTMSRPSPTPARRPPRRRAPSPRPRPTSPTPTRGSRRTATAPTSRHTTPRPWSTPNTRSAPPPT